VRRSWTWCARGTQMLGLAAPLRLLVASTGLKLCSKGEWLLEKHGTATRWSWRALHLGVDAETSRIVAATLTSKNLDDVSQAGPLLDQVAGAVVSVPAENLPDHARLLLDDLAARDPAAIVLVQVAAAIRHPREHVDQTAASSVPLAAESARRLGRAGVRPDEGLPGRSPVQHARAHTLRRRVAARCRHAQPGQATPGLCPPHGKSHRTSHEAASRLSPQFSHPAITPTPPISQQALK